MRFLVLFLAVSQALADTYPRQPGVDALHYTFRLTLVDESDEIQGEATVRLRFLAPVAEVSLDLTSLNDSKGMVVSQVTEGTKPIAYTHQADSLRLKLDPPAKAGDTRPFTIRYHGVPAGGLRIGKTKFGDRSFFGLNWPDKARQWLPMIDHPYDKATTEFLVTAPSHYQVVSNGLLLEERDLPNGRRLTHWKQSVPIASWLATIAVAPYSVRQLPPVKGIPLATWVFPQDRDNGMVTFDAAARDALEFYVNRFGRYPYEKLANIQASGFGGGAEHASAILYGERTVSNRPATNLVAHEIAHQWFGDSVTESDWDDVWLSEGFATYCTLLFVEHYQGRDAFLAGLARSRETIFDVEAKNPKMAVRHQNLADMTKVLNPLVYQKGGWTLHMLRRMIGDDNFWSGMRAYYTRYRDANATTADLRAVMEQQSGADLGWFFEQWLNRPGSPTVEGTWRYDAAAKQVEIDLAQTQAADPYRLRLELLVGGESRTIEMTERHQKFTLASPKPPSTVVLDPQAGTLMHSRFARAQ